MDEIKLKKWESKFKEEVKSLELEFNSFFREQPFSKFYNLHLYNTSHEFVLTIDQSLPEDLKQRLEKLLIDTKPEDSI